MQAEKAAQRRLVGKAGAPRHGLYVEPRVPEQGLDLDNDVVGNHLMGGLAVYLLNDFGQVYGRYAQFIGIKSDLPARFVVFADQHGEPHGDIFLVGIHERALLGARRLLEKDIEIPVIAVYVFANLIFCGRIGFFQCMDLFGIAVGIDKLGDGKISTEEEKNIHTQYMLI